MPDEPLEHRTFTLERVYPKPPDRVWSAWSSLERKKAWFGDGLKELEFRPGGLERSAFETDMGKHTNETRYFEIKDGERIVYAYSMAVDGRVHSVSLATVVFADVPGGTRLIYTEQMCIIPPSDGLEGRQHGWSALLDSLAGTLAQDDGKHDA